MNRRYGEQPDDQDEDEFEDSLGDDDFDYEEFVQREFEGGSSPHRPLWIYTSWVILAAILLPIIIAMLRAIS